MWKSTLYVGWKFSQNLYYVVYTIMSTITIVDRDACCEERSDSRLGTNTDFLDGLSFGEMSYLGWCLYQVASYYVSSSITISIRIRLL